MTNNYFISMQKGFLALMSAALLFSCSSIEPFDASELVESQESIAVNFMSTDPNSRVGDGYNACGTPMTHKLMAGKNTPVGEVTVFNDGDVMYVTVSIEKGEGFDNGDWFIKKIYGWFGEVEYDFETRGKKNIRNPSPGKFPINEMVEVDYGSAYQEYTYELKINDELRKMGQFDVAIHAEVIKVTKFNEDKTAALEYKSEGAWAGDQQFNPEGVGSWALYMSYMVQKCDDLCDRTWTRTVYTGNPGNSTNFVDNNDPETVVDERVFNISSGNRTVGTAKYSVSYLRERGAIYQANIEIEYSIRGELIEDFKFEEYSAYITQINSDIEMEKFNVKKQTNAAGGKITFDMPTTVSQEYYVALLSKISGPCID